MEDRSDVDSAAAEHGFLIRFLADRPDSENENWLVRDGLVVIPKSAVIADNTVI